MTDLDDIHTAHGRALCDMVLSHFAEKFQAARDYIAPPELLARSDSQEYEYGFEDHAGCTAQLGNDNHHSAHMEDITPYFLEALGHDLPHLEDPHTGYEDGEIEEGEYVSSPSVFADDGDDEEEGDEEEGDEEEEEDEEDEDEVGAPIEEDTDEDEETQLDVLLTGSAFRTVSTSSMTSTSSSTSSAPGKRKMTGDESDSSPVTKKARSPTTTKETHHILSTKENVEVVAFIYNTVRRHILQDLTTAVQNEELTATQFDGLGKLPDTAARGFALSLVYQGYRTHTTCQSIVSRILSGKKNDKTTKAIINEFDISIMTDTADLDDFRVCSVTQSTRCAVYTHTLALVMKTAEPEASTYTATDLSLANFPSPSAIVTFRMYIRRYLSNGKKLIPPFAKPKSSTPVKDVQLTCVLLVSVMRWSLIGLLIEGDIPSNDTDAAKVGAVLRGACGDLRKEFIHHHHLFNKEPLSNAAINTYYRREWKWREFGVPYELAKESGVISRHSLFKKSLIIALDCTTNLSMAGRAKVFVEPILTTTATPKKKTKTKKIAKADKRRGNQTEGDARRRPRRKATAAEN